MTVREFAIPVLIFIVIMIVIAVLGVWFNLGPGVSSAARTAGPPFEAPAPPR